MTITTPSTEPAGSLDTDLLLDVRGLQTHFETQFGIVRAVNDVSFTVRPGEVVGIVGESGSGKSVTARSILRMIHKPGRVVGGEVLYRGQDLLGVSDKEMQALRGSEIAMVFQDPQSALNPVMTVGDQIAEALIVHGGEKKASRARALELLEQVGIPDAPRRLDEYPHQFSGGMRQRVVIAIALASSPKLLIADEPTTALDVTIQAQILRLLAQLREDLGVAVLMITHDMGVVAEMCDRVVVMYGGRVMERGPVEAIFSAPQLPYTADLLAAMPKLEDGEEHRLPAIPGAPPDPSRLPTGCSFNPRCRFAEDRCRESVPVLTIRGPEHSAACHVTGDGAPLTPAPPAEATAARREIGGEPLLEITDLRVDVNCGRGGLLGKADPVYAVDGVSLEVRPGETLGLVGESGCGKSTLARAIMGINPVSGGSVCIGGQELGPKDRAGSKRIRETVQYVFQDPFASLNPRRTVRQSIEEALEVRGVPAKEREAEILRLSERVGLNPLHLDRLPHAFSGGQRQRVGIARALAAEPRLLVCDEPVSALDVSIQAQIINLLSDLRDELDLGFLFIAHDLSVVKHISDRVAVMYLGTFVEIGDAEQVYSDPQHPYTASLMASSPKPDVAQRDRERIVLTGDLPSPKNPPTGCRFRTRCPIGPLFRDDRQVCIEQAPTLTPTATGQMAACHFPGELAAPTA
ncbi:ABC transporter ATP-binding protein [Nocardioides bruguierae]|uniref:ABC transporter ATP-binding protein n=1 Tax=Nocardioides bruguierae TaxID=2945102 RepID=A0A9X2D8Q8_9ACTN|nr:ABC transporter ATP-binding protein [Nocardioides bruguierae]MCL8026932.1 ABC transporter ATP-binding protein [Nocardioides bruguierae]MCM0621363.1 ABC transporter ATP-binding protein [Nocardioides bruguierae]